MNLKMLLFASVSLVLFASCHNSDDPYMTLATKTLDVEARMVDFSLLTFHLMSITESITIARPMEAIAIGQLLIRMRHKVRLLSLQSKSLKIHRLVHVSVPFVSLAMM